MRIMDGTITALSVVAFVISIYGIPLEPFALILIFAMISILPYFVKNSRIRIFGYFFFASCVYLNVGKLLTQPEMLGSYTFVLGLSIANAMGAVISTMERSEHAYTYSVAAVAAYPSSFLMAFRQLYPDVTTLLILLLITLSAMWVYFFQSLKAPQLGVREGIIQAAEAAVLTIPIFLLLIVIPWLVYHVIKIEPLSVGIYLFRYTLLSFIATSTAYVFRDFVIYLGGYRKGYKNGRIVFTKDRSW